MLKKHLNNSKRIASIFLAAAYAGTSSFLSTGCAATENSSRESSSLTDKAATFKVIDVVRVVPDSKPGDTIEILELKRIPPVPNDTLNIEPELP